MTAGEQRGDRRNAYSRVPDRGRAASVRPDAHQPIYDMQTGQWTGASDKNHIPSLDGHRHSPLANHNNGIFARNTASTSYFSEHANLEHAMGRLESRHLIGDTGITEPRSGLAHQDAQVAARILADASHLAEDLPYEGVVNEAILFGSGGIFGSARQQSVNPGGLPAWHSYAPL